MEWELGSLVLRVVVVSEIVLRSSVGIIDVKVYEDRNNFTVVVEVVIVFGFID